MDVNITKYMALLKTVEYGSFTRAAEALNYSQSGISRMISDLEREWNLTLLERGKGGVRLTSEGTQILELARRLCEDYQNLQMQIDALHGVQSGIIRIGTISSVAAHWLPNIIKAFQRDYPGVDYELLMGDYGEIEGWIAEGRVDCGFLKLPANPDFDVLPLEKDPLRAILPEDHPLAALDEVPLEALCREPFMLLEKDAKGEISDLLEQNHVVPRVHFTTLDDYAVMSMVESGLGVSILPQLILRRVPYRIAIRPLDVPADREIGLALRGRKSASLAVQRFLEYLKYR